VSESPFKARFEGSVQSWSGLHGSSLAIAVGAAASAHDGVTLIVTRSSHQAQSLARDLELLAVSPLPVQLFPDHETLPYDPFSPHPDIIAERLKTLSSLASMRRGIVLAPVTSLIQRLPPAEYILQRSFDLATGQSLVIDEFRKRLNNVGYDVSEQVYQAGQYAIRGSVVDLYPAGSSTPYRLDLFDEEIDTIRAFDPESQRSTGKVQRIELLPAREYPCDGTALEKFRRAFRMRFDVDTRNVTLYQDLRAGVHPQGLEQYLPLFYEETSFLLDYLAKTPRLLLQPGVFKAGEEHMRRTTERWEQRRHDIERPVLDPWELYFTPENLKQLLQDCDTTHLPDPELKPSGRAAFESMPAPDLHIHERGKEAAADLLAFLDGFEGRVVFAADTPGRRELLRTSLAAFGVMPELFDSFAGFYRGSRRLGLAVLPVDQGFLVSGELALITESQLFGGRTRPKVQRAVSERDPESIIRNLTDLSAGAPVVHEDHGVGRYLGLEVLEIDQRQAEFLMLEYAGGDKL
jgi:transcription-repair coupling factor (superfamily II helicase)